MVRERVASSAVHFFPRGCYFLTSVEVSRHFKHRVSLNEIKTSKRMALLGGNLIFMCCLLTARITGNYNALCLCALDVWPRRVWPRRDAAAHPDLIPWKQVPWISS